MRTTLVVPWVNDALVFQRGSRRKPSYIVLFVKMMLVKWTGKMLKSGWCCKVGFIFKRISLMERLVVEEKSIGTQSHIHVCRGCNDMCACF